MRKLTALLLALLMLLCGAALAESEDEDLSLEDILAGPRATAICRGFERGIAAEELCRKCGYARRFQKGLPVPSGWWMLRRFRFGCGILSGHKRKLPSPLPPQSE